MRHAVLLIVGVAACSPSTQTACEDYLAAVQTCYDDAGVEYDTSVYSETCAIYDGFSDGDTTDVFLCLTDAWEAHDCSEGEALEPECE